MLHLFLFMAVTAEFSMEAYIGDSLINKSSGITLFDNELNIFVNVKKPINQKFFYKGDTLILYYPKECKAFYFSHYNPMNFPIIQFVIGSRKNFDLSPFGYRFLMKKIVADTISTYWLLIRDKSGVRIHLKIFDGRLKTALIERKNRVLHKTIYKDYILKGEWIIPSLVESHYLISDPETKEYIELSNIKFISVFPESLREIKFSEDIEVKKW